MKSTDNQVKVRPVNWTADEVRAALAGRKIQMRLPIKHLKNLIINEGKYPDEEDYSTINVVFTKPVKGMLGVFSGGPFTKDKLLRWFARDYCPFGKVGDRLWVRETHRPMGWSYDDNTVNIQYKDGLKQTYDCYPEYLYPFSYEDLSNNYLSKICDELEAKGCPKASDGDENWQYDEVFDGDGVDRLMSWRSPIAMPRWASRLLLEIVDVRVERLQDISEADAIAEGIAEYGPFGEYRGSKKQRKNCMQYNAYSDARRAYQCVWDSINAKRGYEWASNPWVGVIDFKVLEGV